MMMFPHPWMLLRRLNRPGSARQARVALAVLRRSSSRPCQDDPHSLCERGRACHESDTMALILCADEVWRGRRSEFVLWSPEQTSHALDTQRTQRCLRRRFSICQPGQMAAEAAVPGSVLGWHALVLRPVTFYIVSKPPMASARAAALKHEEEGVNG
ncbi:hypothetical protein DNTS_034109 [Danionella cerebrum]|uniref:Uncharacterized protein n=1 Tax=Danionella cerebrum TaxID=2873325 RepID=A0A553R6P6_9TELE|nr:hypothetical protein DNTS_034109 [Danionella translucida]